MTVVRPSRLQRDGLFGVLVAVFVLVLVRGLAGAQTTGGAVAVAVFAGGVTAILLWAWIAAIMRPARLEITDQAVTLVDGRGKYAVFSVRMSHAAWSVQPSA